MLLNGSVAAGRKTASARRFQRTEERVYVGPPKRWPISMGVPMPLDRLPSLARATISRFLANSMLCETNSRAFNRAKIAVGVPSNE